MSRRQLDLFFKKIKSPQWIENASLFYSGDLLTCRFIIGKKIAFIYTTLKFLPFILLGNKPLWIYEDVIPKFLELWLLLLCHWFVVHKIKRYHFLTLLWYWDWNSYLPSPFTADCSISIPKISNSVTLSFHKTVLYFIIT